MIFLDNYPLDGRFGPAKARRRATSPSWMREASRMHENQLSQLMKTVGIQTDEERIFFLTQLTVFLRKYPDSVFATPDVRMHFLATIQEMLDAKILEENI